MENLPKHLFDNEYYYKVNPDVAKAGVDGYEHYFKHGINEKRDACLNYDELSLDELKCIYYNATPSDLNCGWINDDPFYAKSDIVTHLPVLEYYASQCSHVTELGMQNGQSTMAFLYGLPENGLLESYDIKETKFVTWLNNKNLNKWKFLKKDTLKNLKINETDLIFFSTQIEKFEVYMEKTRKFLVFHSINISKYSCPSKFKVIFATHACNGLLILEKTTSKV